MKYVLALAHIDVNLHGIVPDSQRRIATYMEGIGKKSEKLEN